MKIGDVVTVEAIRAKDNNSHGNARSVTLTSTGEKLGGGPVE
jgi:hypothetical protein